jgi:hypothetical protein
VPSARVPGDCCASDDDHHAGCDAAQAQAHGATYGVTKDGFLVRWQTHAQDGLTHQNTRDSRGAWQLVTPLKVDAVAVAGDRDSPVARLRRTTR